MNDREGPTERTDAPRRWTTAQVTLVGMILAFAVGMLVYRWLHAMKLDQTAALYIGLPTILAVALALTPGAKSATGMIMKGLTILLIMSGPVLNEGIICIIFTAPLFYAVGALVGWAIDRSRRPKDQGGTRAYSLVLIPLLLASMEGLPGSFSLPTEITVQAEKTVAAAPRLVESKLESTPRFDRPVPTFLEKFPRPTHAEGSGLSVGDSRRMFYRRGENTNELVFVVADRAPGYVRFRAVSDNSKVSTWLTWRDAEVRWHPTSDGQTQVQWTLRFERSVSPGWYFGPVEAFGATFAADYLIDALATP